MKLWFVEEGSEFTVYAVDDESKDESLRGFMEQLNADNPAEHARLIKRMERLCEHGPEFRKERDRGVGGGMYELKTKGGTGVLFFYDSATRQVIVCTGGFAKGAKKVQAAQIKRGKRVKADYEKALASGRITEIIVTGDKKPMRIPGS